MDADVWASIGTIVATLVFFVIPGLVYAWYALEHVIGDERSYERVIAMSNGGALT